jgi:hypothetical protein
MMPIMWSTRLWEASRETNEQQIGSRQAGVTYFARAV